MLVQGLDEIVHVGKKFVAFEDASDGRVTAKFEDGSIATGDVLIGADGAGSHVRAQLLPQAKRIETGIMVVSGKLGLNDDIRRVTPRAMFRGPTLILGPKGCFLFGNAVEYEDAKAKGSARQPDSARPTSRPGDSAIPDARPGRAKAQRRRLGAGSTDYDSPFRDRQEYVMWGFSARREKFGLSADLETLHPEDLKTAVLALMKGWDSALRRMVQDTEAADLGAFSVKTSVPIRSWETRNVTLLGDALHNMTPFRGIGANMALRDAAALRQALVGVARGEWPCSAP